MVFFFFRVDLKVAKHFIGPKKIVAKYLTHFNLEAAFCRSLFFSPDIFLESWHVSILFFLRAEQMAWPFCIDCPLHFVDLFPLISGRSSCCRFKQLHFIGHSLRLLLLQKSPGILKGGLNDFFTLKLTTGTWKKASWNRKCIYKPSWLKNLLGSECEVEILLLMFRRVVKILWASQFDA